MTTKLNNQSLAATANKKLKTKTKRAFALLMLALLAPAAAWAQNFGGGSGTFEDPYIIATTAHMSQLATEVNNNGNDYSGVYFELVADLDFQGILYTPIGNLNHNFAGFFNGKNHTIRNVRIGTANATGSFVGLFGEVHASCCIKNLRLASSSINGFSAVGGIAGFVSGWTTLIRRGIRDCIVESDVTISGNHLVGGIVGGTESEVYHCVNFSTSVRGVNRVGAIAGYASQMDYISDCYVIGSCPTGAVGQDGSSTGTDEGVDVKRISTITFDAGFSTAYVHYPSADLTIGSTDYYRCGWEIGAYLDLDREVPEGYYGKEFLVGDMVLEPTPLLPNNFRFILPMADNAHVSIGEVKRDIAYTNWVTISITAQDYTGEVLTPPVTVTDSKDGTPVTLTEGIHYRLELPSGGIIYPGSYNIPVVGIGDFGNRVNVVFQVNNPEFNFEGNGSEQTPYLIQNTDDMDALAQLVNEGFHCQGLHFRLTANLDYTGKTYTPIGTPDNPFCGTFDGFSNIISHISIDDNGIDNQGIFGCIENATVKHLRLANSRIKGRFRIGGIVGQGKGNIESCHITEDVIIGGHENAGGIVGQFDSGSITYCENHATVFGGNNAGGIVGCVEDNAQGVSIVECFNFGSIELSIGSCFGGIIGKIGASCVYTVAGCINEGNVSCNEYGGGIVGTIGLDYWETISTFKDNLNLGAVSAIPSKCGGIVGEIQVSFGIWVRVSNNYYAGNCQLSCAFGNAGNDVFGKAMRGWIVSADEENLFAQMWPIDEETGNFVGIAYDGNYYAGAGETTKLIIEKLPEAPEGIIAASAGILKPLDEEYYDEINDVFYLLTMPTEGSNVNLTIAEPTTLTVAGYGTSAGGYRFIASPVVCNVAAATVTNIFGASAYGLYRFDQSEELEWRNHKDQAFELENGKGYLYASNEDVNLVFRGTYNTATEPVEVPLTYDQNADFAGWNLVGNPFPVAAYANKSYYKMNEAGTAIEPVAVSSSTAINACTGVMVKAETTGETVTFSRTAQQSTGNNGTIQIAVAQADTRGNAIQDKAIVSFNAGDRLEKFVFGETDAKIYIPQGGKDYAVATVGRDAPWHVSTTDEIPINFKAAKNGTYTLTFDTQNLDWDYLHLIDNLTGADVDLLNVNHEAVIAGEDPQSPAHSYTFTAKTTDYASRFRLVFSTPVDETSANRPFAYIADGEIRINEADARGASIQVVDVMGRVIVSRDVACNVSTNGMASGIYILRLVNGDDVRTQKIVIP